MKFLCFVNKQGAPVAFEIVEEDRENKYHRDMPRSHMYQETRPKFRTYANNHDSNTVRAINVHQLNRINWETDCIQTDENEESAKYKYDEDELMDNSKQIESVSDEVLTSVKYRNDMRKRDVMNGRGTMDKIKRKYGDGVDVNNMTLEEIEKDEDMKRKYYEDKDYRLRQYPFGVDETDIYEQDLAKYPQWFPELNKKYGDKYNMN